MGLSPGTRLGPHEILAPLGAGGMGEVYRARDTRLDRSVAIKVLASYLSSSPELRERFEREAHAISSLNHPRICILHDVGQHDGADYLVMEYLEGQTLAERLAKGPLPIREVVRIGAEICEGLEAAHRQGLVHRDLKPGNVMLTKGGAKLMDFGLAKPLGVAATSAVSGSPPSFTAVATMSGPSPLSPLTAAGSIVGTIQYMSPEQIEGREADARSDIFAFGAVLYEMTAGKRAFQGKSQLSIASAILEHEPAPLSSVLPLTPPALERIIQTCLAKDPAQRFQSAHDIALQLGWIATKEEVAEAPKQAASSRAGWIAAAALLVVTAVLGLVALRTGSQAPVLQAAIATPQGMTVEFVGDFSAPPTLSPDGTMLAIRAHTKEDPGGALWVRHLDTDAWQRLEGTEKALFPFWSPDSRNLAFFTTDQKMRRIGLSGGSVADIAAAPVGRGGSWGKDDIILFAPDFQSGIFRVNANGGTPVPVTKLDRALQTTHRWPQWLPDGKHFLYFAGSHVGIDHRESGVYFASVEGKENRKLLTTDANAVYANGYLLSRSQSALQARRFNPRTGEFEGEAVAINDDLQFDSSTWHCSVSASDTGLLVFAQGGQAAGAELAWFNRSGKAEVVTNVERADYLDLKLSPDGHRVVVVRADPYASLWAIDLDRGSPTKLTFDNNDHFTPVWSPDGKRIAFGQAAAAGSTTQFGVGAAIHILNADGSGNNQEVLPADDPTTGINLLDWTRDGKYLIYARRPGLRAGAIWALPLTGDNKPFPLVTAQDFSINIPQARVSPDGHWLAYTSDESGRTEVYLTSFPVASGKIAISNGGALDPRWRGDGRELFFGILTGSVVAMDVKQKGAEIQLGQQHTMFSVTDTTLHWDVRSDGQRFLSTNIPETVSKPMTLISNWTQLLKK